MRKRRPNPPDQERRRLVRVELAKRDMTISDLARALNINRGHLSETISGTRRTKKIEERVAAFFGMDRWALFPPRTRNDLEAMRAAAAAKGRAA
jgi:plasmid maintenance system antidote protein VapI